MNLYIEALLPTGEKKIGRLEVKNGMAFVVNNDKNAGEMFYAIQEIVSYVGIYGLNSVFLGEKKK